LVEIGPNREIVPVRFAGLDFWFLFLSPHAEAGDDPEFLSQMLETVDVQGFIPSQDSRLIKFCRADAEQDHFKPADWHLPAAFQIFQFAEILGDVMQMYIDEAPDVEQFLYLPASAKLGRLYSRIFDKLAKQPHFQIAAILPLTGTCHAYQRT
jgi:hypothetical protein